jgi:imidazole glycerol-phosphate synthase subunit HisF
MTSRIRIIPRLDIKGPNLVKGIHLEGLRVLGKPHRFARHYYETGADELIYMDVVASLYGRNNLLEVVERTSRDIFIPLTVGGGVRSLDDIRSLLRAGADKVAINTMAIRDPDLIRRAARAFGSSTIVVSIEAIRHEDGTYEAYTDNGRESTGVEVFEWARRVCELGAGEILLTSINNEGTGSGFDLELVGRVAGSAPIPVIACGGAGCAEHVAEAVGAGRADAVAVASLLHYAAVDRCAGDDDFSDEGNLVFLTSGRTFSRIRPIDLPGLKARLTERGISCRMSSPKEGARV